MSLHLLPNGQVERKNKHVVELSLSMIAQSSLPLSYWCYAFPTASYLINRLPTHVLQKKSPYETLFEKKNLPTITYVSSVVLAFPTYGLTMITNCSHGPRSVFFLDIVPIIKAICVYTHLQVDFMCHNMSSSMNMPFMPP